MSGRRRGLGSVSIQAVIVVIIGVVFGTAANLLSPQKVPWVEDWTNRTKNAAEKSEFRLVTVAEAQALVDAGEHVALDARPTDDFTEAHIPGAMSLPFGNEEEFEPAFEMIQALLPPEQPLITYCSSPDCDAALQLSLFLREQGYTNIVLFIGGFDEWRAKSLPVEEGF